MLLRNKILLIIVFPLVVLASYQFFVIEHTFNTISEVRSEVFVESAREVKFANDVQFLTSLMSSTLFEIETSFEQGDTAAFEKSLRLYREIQQQRYYALQELRETFTDAANHTFEFIAVLDENKFVEFESISQKIKNLDEHNEKIISIVARSRDTNTSSDERFEHIQASNALTREVVGELAALTNKRYLKVDEVSKQVEVTENDAKGAMIMVSLIGYAAGGLLVLIFYVLVILPLERFTRAIEMKRMDTIEWTAYEPFREDEIGQLYRALEKCMVHHAEKNASTKRVRSTKTKKIAKKSSSI